MEQLLACQTGLPQQGIPETKEMGGLALPGTHSVPFVSFELLALAPLSVLHKFSFYVLGSVPHLCFYFLFCFETGSLYVALTLGLCSPH